MKTSIKNYMVMSVAAVATMYVGLAGAAQSTLSPELQAVAGKTVGWWGPGGYYHRPGFGIYVGPGFYHGYGGYGYGGYGYGGYGYSGYRYSGYWQCVRRCQWRTGGAYWYCRNRC